MAITIQKNIRRSIARSHYLRRRNSIIKERELTFAGRALYLLSLETEKKRQILTSSSNPDMMVAAELPRIFLYYTSANGTYTLNEESAEPLFVNLGRFIKFCNAVTGLLTKDFTARNAEHCFEQVVLCMYIRTFKGYCRKRESSRGLGHKICIVTFCVDRPKLGIKKKD